MIIVLRGRPDATASKSAKHAAAQAQQCDARTEHAFDVEGVETGITNARQGGQALVVLVDPDVERPFAAARRLARNHPELRFVFAVDPVKEPQARGEAVFAGPPGGRWSMAPARDDEVQRQLRQALALCEQQARLRTTLDRMRLRLSSVAPADSSEYRRLVASDRYLASVLQSAHDAIVSVDPAGLVVSWNAGAERLFGIGQAQAARLALRSLFDDPEAFDAKLHTAYLTGEARVELASRSNRQAKYVDAAFDRIGDDEGHVIGIAVIMRDITERHLLEEELRSHSRQKDEFLAVLAHELRNPLAPIRNAAHVLHVLNLTDERARKAVEMIRRQATHMTGLIDDLLDIARVTRGVITLELEPLPIGVAVSEAVEQVRALIESKHHRLTVTHASSAALVLADRKRLTQIFANLLNNSAKFTPDGGQISVQIEAEDQGVQVSVTDNGIGIAANSLPKVFDLFLRCEPGLSAASGGLGIGLALVQRLTLLHNGTVTVHSAGPGAGSTFAVRLPRLSDADAEVDPGVAAAAAAGAIRRLTLLVVDDNEDAAHSLAMLLMTHGHTVHAETDPRRALEQAVALQPDAVIVDIGMPHINGYELARMLRGAPLQPSPALIALTGHGQAIDRVRAKEAGFDHHFVKPIEPKAMLTFLDRLGGAPARG
ncbi:ATP-binding protein [Schlegelella sp. S2-27]|uniref:histidine kinase n=1 Tax=Caldimonas mangrovi TaxID=2944811 RepID=A0ABT0YN11_9BURK|nr:ATP-binding protein [Caldimonas mangrovi]MCM5680053.1 ATP-binding protein [Caldimonas mangrovi]